MHLVLFDIDGTLTHSNAIDDDIYLRSLAEIFGFTGLQGDWSAYRHTTDSGILQEIFESRLGRGPSIAEVDKFRRHFVDAIAAEAARTPFREIKGARLALSRIGTLSSTCVALATGGWSDSARCKMRSAGMNYDAFPAASADDAHARTAIMRTAVDRAVSRMGRGPDGIVYVGDAVWDARACRQLGVPFVGISADSDAETLRAAGAQAVFADYSDIAEFCSALQHALRVD